MAAPRACSGRDEVEARASGGKDEVAPREAAFVLGLLSASEAWRARAEAGADAHALGEALARAGPQDCLDAAFADTGAMEPHAAIAAARDGLPCEAPFLDEDYFAAIARWLGCAFAARLESGTRPARTEALAGGPDRIATIRDPEGTLVAIAPEPAWLPSLARLAATRPELMRRVVVTTPAALAAQRASGTPKVCAGRLGPLHAAPPALIADRVATGRQIAMAVCTVLALALALFAAPLATLVAAVVTVNLALLAHAATRTFAAVEQARPGALLPRAALADDALPLYSVLVPLYREAGAVPQLVRALGEIDYPRERLDIQFLVEHDDEVTRAALEAHAGRLGATITVVPPGGPKTKPKALNVGLRRARGALVTIFDAEDRPDPQQLRVAAETFAAAPDQLAVLQARLVVDHAGDSWITAMFAIEYAALFDGILPTVARRGLLFLLGGTSNHFRREALNEVGGWDPFNVTEDADLAVRLKRFGYEVGVIDSPTYEEAPMTAGAWMRQRTRWFKGWLQTWLVHNRRPLRLVRELGVLDALMLHTFILGAFLAVLAHPVFLALLGLHAAGAISLAPEGGVWPVAAFTLNAAIFLLGYGATFWLGLACIRRRGLAVRRLAVLTLPAYWLLMFAALVSAAFDLVRRPHYWAKTTHGLATRPQPPILMRGRRMGGAEERVGAGAPA